MAVAPLISPLAFQNSAKMTVMTPPAQTKPPPAKFEIAPLTQEQLAQALTYLLKVSGFFLFVCFWLCFCFDYIVNCVKISHHFINHSEAVSSTSRCHWLENVAPLYQPISRNFSEAVSSTTLCDWLKSITALYRPISHNFWKAVSATTLCDWLKSVTTLYQPISRNFPEAVLSTDPCNFLECYPATS